MIASRTWLRHVATLALSAIAITAARADAQSRSADDAMLPRFEAASIKVNRTGHAGEAIDRMGMRPDGSFRGQNIAVGVLLDVAYGYPDERIAGLPKWADDERFDVIAKAPASALSATATIPQQVALMMRALLAERFKLVAHGEIREGPVYELRLARADGKLGPGLVRADREDCEAIEAGRREHPLVPDDRPHPSCGGSLSLGTFTAGGMRIEQLADGMLTRMLGRPVIDRTGLGGRFDIALTFAFGEMPRSMPFVSAGDSIPADPNRTTFFTAIQEQLGLKLEPARAPVDVLVIDHIEQPDPD